MVERASEIISADDAEKMAEKFKRAPSTLMIWQPSWSKCSKWGDERNHGVFARIGKIKDKIKEAGMNDGVIRQQLAVVRSMTRKERRDYRLLNASRKRRIAAGSGTTVADVNRLIKQFQQMQQMMKQMGKMGKIGLMPQGLKGIFGR